MLNYSFSSVLMAILTSNLIIITIAICFRSDKILLSVGYKLLAVFLIFTLIRFVFPFEIEIIKDTKIATNVVLPQFLSIVLAYFRQVLFKPFNIKISLWTLFEIIWVIGIIYKTILYLRKLNAYEYYVACWSEDVTEEEPYRSCLAEACGGRKNKFRILKLPEMTSPCLYGIWKPRILISADMEMTDKQLYYVLCHEVSHYYHQDLVIKRVVSILCILYWWNPICSIFQKQVNTLLEMRIDDSLVRNDTKVGKAYLSTLIHIVENAGSTSNVPDDFTVSLSQQNSTTLTKRFEMVCNKKPHATNILISAGLLAIIAAIYVGSYMVIFENRYLIESEKVEDTEYLLGTVYAILKDDGTYDIYNGDYFIENVETLENHNKDIPIYNQK